MLKYISDAVGRLLRLKAGIEKNPDRWSGQSTTPAAIQTIVDGLNKVDKEADDAQNLAISKHSEARSLTAAAELEADSISNLAIGLEKGSPEKLSNDYGINVKKSFSPKPVPTVGHLVTLKDDVDGEGFVVSTNVDPDASMYEWQKGPAADPLKTDIIPELRFFKATKKSYFVDDDVIKGVRYFYRVRATNSAGAGAWSEPVSSVQ